MKVLMLCYSINSALYSISKPMKDIGQLYRVNYAITKHHREQLHEQIDPKLIEKIQISENPSLNYKNAFKTVYHDELQKTLEYQEEKRQQERLNHHFLPDIRNSETKQIYKNNSSSSLDYAKQINLNNNPFLANPDFHPQKKSPPHRSFADYETQRNKKFDNHIEKVYDGGQSFFKAQDEYQKHKQQQSINLKNTLAQQLKMNEYKKMRNEFDHQHEIQNLKQNHLRGIQLEQFRLEQQKQDKIHFGEEVKHQMEHELAARAQRSHFEYSNENRHNPITNPIQYHIDNPYILQKYQQKIHYEQ